MVELTSGEYKQILASPTLFAVSVLGIKPTRYQADLLEATRDSIVVWGRQCGKTTTLAIKTLHYALTHPKREVLIIAPTQRQAGIMFNKIYDYCKENAFVKAHTQKLTLGEVEFDSGSRIRCLPAGHEGTGIRGYAASMVVFDEAAFIPDAVFMAVRPSMSVRGEITVLSGTPFGKHGYFYNMYHSNELRKPQARTWDTFHVRSSDSPLIDKNYLEEMRNSLTVDQFAQEFNAEFTADNASYFPAPLLMGAMNDYEYALPLTKNLPKEAKLIMGVDIARAGCFDGETEVLTEKGWKRFEAVEIGERVLSMNPVNKEASYYPIAAKQVYDYVGDMILNEGQQTNLMVTPNHNMLREMKHGGKIVFEQRSQLGKTGYLPRDFIWKGVSPPLEIVFPPFRKPMPNGGVHELPEIKFRMDDWFRFLGWYISEGWVEKRKDGRRVIGIAQTTPSKMEEIRELLDKMGIRYRMRRGKVAIDFWNKRIGDWLDEHCYVVRQKRNAHAKAVPQIVKTASPKWIDLFLTTFAKGDGHKFTDGRGVAYYTSSEQLANDLQELSFKAGHVISLSWKNVESEEVMFGTRKAVRHGKMFVLHQYASNERIDVREFVKSGKQVPFNGKVYDLTVYPYHTLFVRRKGKAVWTGNSDETALCLCSVTADKMYRVEWTQQYGHLTIVETAGHIVELAREYPDMKVYIDETGVGGGALDVVREKNVDVVGIVFTMSNRNRMYQNLKMALEQHRIKYSAEDKKMTRQFDNYTGKASSDGSFHIVKGDGHDDCVDALALCFAGAMELEWLPFGEGIQLNPYRRIEQNANPKWSFGIEQ